LLALTKNSTFNGIMLPSAQPLLIARSSARVRVGVVTLSLRFPPNFLIRTQVRCQPSLFGMDITLWKERGSRTYIAKRTDPCREVTAKAKRTFAL
jgi:hypothetical protein